jgi:hypothetical protein
LNSAGINIDLSNDLHGILPEKRALNGRNTDEKDEFVLLSARANTTVEFSPG